MRHFIGARAWGRTAAVKAWDGLCGHPSGLRTPEEMTKIAQAKIEAMEKHPGLEWLRREDEEAKRS